MFDLCMSGIVGMMFAFSLSFTLLGRVQSMVLGWVCTVLLGVVFSGFLVAYLRERGRGVE